MHLQTGMPNWVTSQSAQSTSAKKVCSVRPSRHRAVVKNIDAAITVYVGVDTNVTSSIGMPLLAGESISLYTYGEVWVIAASATPSVAIIEEF